MKYKKILLVLVFAIFALIFFNTTVYAGDLKLKNLNYDVSLNSDGTANVTETWRIYIEDTNTLFKTFNINSSKYSGITDVSVCEISNNSQRNFSRIYQEKYHVDKDCFYALENSSGKFEIAWGAHAEDVTRTYNISYTIVDAIKNYSDCSEFYWQFIGTDSEIPATKVTGTIKLPTSVIDIEDLKVWAHGPLNGNIERKSADTVYFEVDDLRTNTMLETRVVTPTYVFDENLNTSTLDKLDSILSEEQAWADAANARREEIAKRRAIFTGFLIVLFSATNIAGIFIGILIIKKIKKYKKVLEDNKKIVVSQKLEYFRDIPNEDATPAQASFLYYFKNGVLQNNIPKVMSATFLDLSLKKLLEFEVNPNKKNDIKIILTSSGDKLAKLSEDEIIIYNLLKSVSKNKDSFSMDDLQKYFKDHPTKILSLVSDISSKAKEIEERLGNFSSELENKSTNYTAKAVGFVFLAIFGFIPMIFAFIPSIIAAVYCFRLSSNFNTLTQQGEDEKEQWIGLKKYMNDFSLLKEREVPELALWEKYLVYATAFGIAEKVLKQLKVVYPQFSDENYMNNSGYAYLYLMNSRHFNDSFLNTLDRSFTNAYSSATNYSSGGGSGGGFSGGGGRRWRRWPEWAEDNFVKIIN